MGLRGPAPKPTAIALAEGNPGHRPINRDEPTAPAGEPPMPSDLTKAAQAIWRDTVRTLAQVPGLLTIAEADIIADYCRTLAKKQVLEAAMKHELKRKLAVRKASLKDPAVDPATVPSKEELEAAVLANYENRILRLTRMVTQLNDRLGLNAAARSRMHIEGPVAAPRPADPAQAGLFGNTRSGPQLVAV